MYKMWVSICLLILPAISLVLSALSLLAGYEKGFMQEYYIARVNIEKLTAGLLLKDDDSDKDKNSNTSDDDLPILISDGISDGPAEILEEAAQSLDGILDGKTIWYSIHIMNGCEGTSDPASISTNPVLRVSGCTRPTAGSDTGTVRLNLSQIISSEFLASLNLLPNVSLTSEIQGKFDVLNHALLALFILHCLCMVFGVMTFCCCALTALGQRLDFSPLISLSISALGTAVFIVTSTVITAAMSRTVKEINDIGEFLGVLAARNSKLLSISWVGTALMIVVTIHWVFIFFKFTQRKQGPNYGTPKLIGP